MNISLLNEKIMIQKNMVDVDVIGNHVDKWEDYFSCHATIAGSSAGGKDGSEKRDAGQTLDVTDLSFTVRFCIMTACVNIKEYRIIFRDEIYDITGIDYMNFKKRALKFKCRKARR